jgi:hypothetical protein
MKAGGKPNNWWAENFGLCRKQGEMEEWASVPIGLPWDRMKQLGTHMTTE